MKIRTKAPYGVEVTYYFKSWVKWILFWSDATTIGSTVHIKGGHEWTQVVNLGDVAFFGHETRHVEQKLSLWKYVFSKSYRDAAELDARTVGAERMRDPVWQKFVCGILSQEFGGLVFRM